MGAKAFLREGLFSCEVWISKGVVDASDTKNSALEVHSPITCNLFLIVLQNCLQDCFSAGIVAARRGTMAARASALKDMSVVFDDADDNAHGWAVRCYFIRMARLERSLGRTLNSPADANDRGAVPRGDDLGIKRAINKKNTMDSFSVNV